MEELAINIPSLIADALEKIQNTAVAAGNAENKVAIVPIPDHPQGHLLIVKPDGSYEVHEPPREKFAHSLLTVDEIAGYVESVLGDGERSQVFVCETHVEVRHDEDQDFPNRDSGVVTLRKTPEMKLLEKLSREKHQLTQRDFIRMLRVDLRDVQTDEVEALIRICRKLDFKNSQGGRSEVDRGRESLGMEIQSQVAALEGDIPEEVPLSVRVFDDMGLTKRFRLICGVEIDAADRTFELLPNQTDLKKIVDEQLSEITEILRSELSIPIFLGHM